VNVDFLNKSIDLLLLFFYLYQSTEITLPSEKQYQLHYDVNHNLRSVVTPGLAHHHFGRLISPGTDRDIYWPPTTKSISGTTASVSKDSVAFDFDGAGRRIRTSYPSGRRRVVYRYGSLGQLNVIAFDQTDIEYRYNPESMKLDKIVMTDLVSGNRSSVLEYANSSEALITSHNVSSHVDVALASANFRYEYDAHFRTSLISVTISGTRLPSSVYQYRKETGLLEQMSGFQFQVGTTQNGQRIVTRDGNIEMSRELDGFGRQTDVSYTFNNYIVFTLEVSYHLLTAASMLMTSISSLIVHHFRTNRFFSSTILRCTLNGCVQVCYLFPPGEIRCTRSNASMAS
jgi:hypothetical protein